MKKIFLAMLVFSSLAFSSAQAFEPLEMQCIEYKAGIDMLNKNNAAIRARGITNTDVMVELYYNLKSQGWSLFAVVPNGKGDMFLCEIGGGPDIEFFNGAPGIPA
jgi:hypothetical protein